MSNQDLNTNALHADLALLRAEVNKLGEGETERTRLEQLVVDIEAEIELARLGKSSESLVLDVQEVIEEFESRHPTATAILNNIMMALSSMGV